MDVPTCEEYILPLNYPSIYDKWAIMKFMSPNIFFMQFFNIISSTCSSIQNYF
jgi:hypothetical protein